MGTFRYLLVMILAVLLLTAAGCGGGGKGVEPSGDQPGGESDEKGEKSGDENGGKTSNPDVSVAVNAPEGWEKKESSGGALIYEKDAYSMTISRDRVSAGDAGSDDYLSYVQNKLYKVGQVEFSSAEDVKVGGLDGKRFFATTEMGGIGFKHFIVYAVREGYIYVLSGATMTEDFDSVLPDFEAFISSFRFE